MTTLDKVKADLKIKVMATLCLIAFVVCVFFFSPQNTSNLLAGAFVFGLLFIIFVIGICSDFKAMKHYKEHLKDMGKDKNGNYINDN